MPASFREVLSRQAFQGIVTFRSLHLTAIEGFGMDRMEQLSAQMDQFHMFSQVQDDWMASIFADAQQLPFDKDGRVILGEELKQYAQIKDKVAFVGRGPTFQLWNPDLFQEHQAAARQRLARESHKTGLSTDESMRHG